MKIAVPVTNDGRLDSHFGHCAFYNIYSITDDNRIADVYMIPSVNGCGCKSGIASTLSEEGVALMLAGGIGAGAINVLNSNGIEVIRGCVGNSDDIVRKYLEGGITDSGESCAQHVHHHGHDHDHHHGEGHFHSN